MITFIDCPDCNKCEKLNHYQMARYGAIQKEEPREKLKEFERRMRMKGWIVFLTDIDYFSEPEVKRYNRKFRLGGSK